MRKYFIILLVLWIGAVSYGYIQNPVAFKKLTSDLANDLPPIFVPTKVTSKAFGDAWSTRGASLLNLVLTGGSTNSAEPAPPAAPATNSAPVAISPAPASPAAISPATPTPAAVSPPTSAPVVTPAQQQALAAWSGPTSIPSNAGWTWTTPEGVYHDVQIVRVEADCVTIIHHDGGALVPIAELPADLQKQLNYNADAAVAAAAQRKKDDLASAKVMSQERSQGTGQATDYNGALAAAKSSGKPVLLHFTGSDWCPYCKMLDSEVLSSQTFGAFVGTNYIFLTLDFPHDLPQSDDVKHQNQALAQKFGVTGYPTLLVIDSSERVLGRIAGYNPGSGPDAVISQLKAFNH